MGILGIRYWILENGGEKRNEAQTFGEFLQFGTHTLGARKGTGRPLVKRCVITQHAGGGA
ncbi:MAG: hypothetical protein ACFFCW_08105 [Candidatus Hodarchaeota archaeon]